MSSFAVKGLGKLTNRGASLLSAEN